METFSEHISLHLPDVHLFWANVDLSQILFKHLNLGDSSAFNCIQLRQKIIFWNQLAAWHLFVEISRGRCKLSG